MQETLIINPNGTDDLNVRTLKVMKIIIRELGDRIDRVDYNLIKAELGIEWNQVRYSVTALCKAGALEKVDGKLRVLKKIVL